MNKTEIIFSFVIKTSRYAAKVLQPSKKTLDFPTTFVTAQNATVLRLWLFSVSLVRRNHFNALFFERLIEWVGIISLIANQSSGRSRNETRLKSLADKSDFMRRSTVCVDGEWKRSIVCHDHEFRAFAPLSLTNSCAPFLATTKVPSIKHSLKSILPLVSKSWAKVSSTFLKLPSFTQPWKRRWQVWYGGNLSGKSFHRAPERKIQIMPFIISRLSRHGRPLPSSRFGNSASNGSIKAHCSSVNSSPRAMNKILARAIYETSSNKNPWKNNRYCSAIKSSPVNSSEIVNAFSANV